MNWKQLVGKMFIMQEYYMSRWISSMSVLWAGPYSSNLLPAPG